MMGTTVIENSKSEKYLGDQIHEDGCEASITATLNGRIQGAMEAADDIIHSINPIRSGGGVGHHANGIIKKLFFWPLEHGRKLIDF